MKVIFWLSLFFIFYCYLGYPLVITLLAGIFGRPVKKADTLPLVSVVISVWNEEDVMEAKIRNLLSLDYPLEKMEILIGSDSSTDRTDEIIRRFVRPGIQLVESPCRRGKAAMINDLVHRAKNEIIVFTDARQIFDRGAIRELVRNFSDKEVGCVSGELLFLKKEGWTAKGINLYWEYEKFIRSQESRIHSMLGATGAIYAIRRELYRAVPENVVLDDMFVPFMIILQGYRAVFDPQATAYDEAAENPKEEYRRKARTLYGNYQIFGLIPQMFNLFKSPVALQLFSHKFLRVVVPFLMIAAFFSNMGLLSGVFYRRVFILQIIFYAMAAVGGLVKNKDSDILRGIFRVCAIPYVFCLLNFSALMGFWRFVAGRQEVTWEKARIS